MVMVEEFRKRGGGERTKIGRRKKEKMNQFRL
jgi:hypothetical protein